LSLRQPRASLSITSSCVYHFFFHFWFSILLIHNFLTLSLPA